MFKEITYKGKSLTGFEGVVVKTDEPARVVELVPILDDSCHPTIIDVPFEDVVAVRDALNEAIRSYGLGGESDVRMDGDQEP